MEFVVVAFRLKGVKSGDEVQFFSFSAFNNIAITVGATVFFHFQPSTILHLYPRYRVKRPCDGSVFNFASLLSTVQG